MLRYKYSEAMRRKIGLDYNERGYIFFLLHSRYCRAGGELYETVIDICREVAGAEWKPLYIFLTDRYRNHNYIYTTYNIPVKLLFRRRRETYKKIAEYLKIGK